jgi:hypothetical protein
MCLATAETEMGLVEARLFLADGGGWCSGCLLGAVSVQAVRPLARVMDSRRKSMMALWSCSHCCPSIKSKESFMSRYKRPHRKGVALHFDADGDLAFTDGVGSICHHQLLSAGLDD